MAQVPGFLLRLAVAAMVCLAGGCRDNESAAGKKNRPEPSSGDLAAPQPFDPESVRAEVVAFCGDCHEMPPASAYSKEQWVEEVARGFEFYRTSGRYDLDPPRQSSVVSFFQAQAPEKIVFDEPKPAGKPLSVPFRSQVLELPSGTSDSTVAYLLWQPPNDRSVGRLLFSDMYGGDVYEIALPAENLAATRLAHLGNPAIIEPADLDADGKVDYLVGDLGKFLPSDHDRGRVMWLNSRPDGGWAGDVLRGGLGRVSHAVGGDFDGDGDSDVLVAEFGWRKSGRILLLRREDKVAGAPHYELEVIDPRHGASHVRPLDWDGDGDLDFIALISQEHEKVELFVNDGRGKFRVETIFDAGDPAYGSSGIELVDFDGDGDLDVLLSNGDSMDSDTLKPSHGVRWLENAGKTPFAMHLLAGLPGAYRAVAGDIDGDGDLDVVAIAFPPLGTSPETWQTKDLLVVLEQTAPGEFTRHVLPEKVGGTALTIGDFDGDGDLDLASGAFHKGADKTWVTVWWNEGIGAKDQ